MLASAGSGGVPDTEGQLECLGSQKIVRRLQIAPRPEVGGVSSPNPRIVQGSGTCLQKGFPMTKRIMSLINYVNAWDA